MDHRDIERHRRIWHPDAVYDLGTWGVYKGIDEIIACIEGYFRDLPEMHHWIVNLAIDIDGDSATGITALNCMMTDRVVGPQMVSGTYYDEFERRSGRWAFSSRRFVRDYAIPVASLGYVDGAADSKDDDGPQ
jgi:hypothetical protein